MPPPYSPRMVKKCAHCENLECDVRVGDNISSANRIRLHYDVIFLRFMLNKSKLRLSLRWISKLTVADLKMEGEVKRRLSNVIKFFQKDFITCLRYCQACNKCARLARMVFPIIKLEQKEPVLLLKRLIDLVHTECLPDYLEVRVNDTTETLIDQWRELINTISKLDGLAELHKAYLALKHERVQKNKEGQKLAQTVDKAVKTEVNTAAPTTKSSSKNTTISSRIATRKLRLKKEPESGNVIDGNEDHDEANDASSCALTLPLANKRNLPVTLNRSETMRDDTQQEGTSTCTPTVRSKKNTNKKVSSSSREQSTTLLSLSDDDKSDDDSDDEEEAELSSPVVERISRMLLRRGRKRVREEDSEESAAKRRSVECAELGNAERDVRVGEHVSSADCVRLHYDVILLDFMLNKSRLRGSLKWIRRINFTNLEITKRDKMRLRSVVNHFHGQFRHRLRPRPGNLSPIIKLEEKKPIQLLKRLINLVQKDCLSESDYLEVPVNATTQTLIDQRRELINSISKLNGLDKLHKVYLIFKPKVAKKNKEEQKLTQMVAKAVKTEVNTAAPTTKSPSKDTTICSQIAARELRVKREPESGNVTDGNKDGDVENDTSGPTPTFPLTSTFEGTRNPLVTQKMSEKIRDNTQQEGTSKFTCTPTARSKKKTSKTASSSSRDQSTTLLSLSDDDKSDDDSDEEEEAELSSPVVERVSRMLLRRGRKRVREEDSEESAAKRRSVDELQRLQIEADKQVRLFEIFMRFAEQRILDLPKKKKIELATQVYKALVSKDVHIANNASVLCEKIAGVHRL